MRSSSPLIIFLLFIIPGTVFSQFTLPFFEDFSDSECDDPTVGGCSGPLPAGWTFPISDDLSYGSPQGDSITWRAGNMGFSGHAIGNPPPAAYMYWAPSYYDYDFRMTSPTIYVGNAEQVQVSFDMELDYYAPNSTNSLSIEYRTPGQNWQEVLGYEVLEDIDVNFPLRNDSYMADVTDSIQLGFRSYGENSYDINSWDIDNVTVTAVPQLTNVSISSNNPLDSTLAVTGDTITLKFTADTPLIGTSAIIADSLLTQENITNISGNTWQATYVVQNNDEDGPVSFVAMFKGEYFVADTSVEVYGNPKTVTTDNSLVVIDRTGPGEFELGAVNTFEALETDTIWYSNDDSLRMLVNIPPDTAIVKFLYSSGTSLSTGTDEFVTIDVSGNPLQPATDHLTVEAWIKPDSTYQNYDGFLSYADLPADSSDWKGYGWFYFGSGWHFFLRTDTPAPNEWADATGNEWPVAAVQTGEWSHLAATYDGTHLKTYRNGIMTEIEPKTASGSIQYSASTDVLIGKFVFGSDEGFFDGKIDEVRIWEVARTQTEIQGYMNQSLTGEEDGLIGYWRFDEGTGGSVNDASINSNNGTIPSASLWDTNDSPIDFKEDSLAFDQLVGAYAQLTDSTFGNQPLNIGNLSILTQADITAGQRMVTAMDTEYEAVTGIIDSSTHFIGSRILDQAGNARAGNNPKRITVDNLPPSIDSAYIYDTENMIINFSEGLFQSDNGTGEVQKTEFQLYFEQNENNGGTANIVPVGGDSLISISKVLTGDLVGGERDIRFYFDVDTVASGDETVEITVQNSTIFDQYGNQMLTTVTTGPIFLNDLIAPYVENSTIAISNAFVEIIFNESVYSADSGVTIDPAHFANIIFNPGVGGNATNVSITGVTKNDGNPLSGGEDTIRINLDVTGLPSGTETIIIPPNLNKIKDRGTPPNFLTDSSGILYLNKYPWIKPESVDNLDENNAFAQIVFSDTVFNSSGAALTSSDFSGLDFQQGAGGNATAATIDSITNTNDIVLNTGEDTIRVYLNITGIPSGEETIEIGPLNDTSIVNSISNPLAITDTLLFTLKDKLPPTIDSASVNNANDFILFFASESLWTNPEHSQPLIDQDFELGFIQNINIGGTVQGATIAALKKEDGVSDLTGGEKIIKIYLGLTPPGQLASGDEQILVKVKDGASIYDRNGNPMGSGASTDSLTLYDKLPPSIDSLQIINSNDYANLYFSEGIYNSTTGPIEPEDFDDTFSPGVGGNATNVSITGVTNDAGNPLSGGEKTIRIYLDVTGLPSGTESIEVKPQDGASIKDFSDNYMGAAATITDFLNKYPWIKPESVDNLDENNAFAQIVFSDTVFNSSGAALTSSDFSGLDFQQGAGGNATAATIDSITNTNDIVLNTGEDTIRVYLNITGIPSGEETIEIGPLSGTSIVNSISNPLAITDTLLFTLKDKLPPTIDSASVNNANDFILFFASESLWTNPEHSQPLIDQDFELGFTQNINMGGTVQGATIAALKKEDGVSDLTGGEKTIAIMLTLTPPGQPASGYEQILAKVKDGASIYDRNGNPMDNGVSTDSLTLHDKLPPGIDSLQIINSNDYANLYFSEGIYNSTTGPIEPEDFDDTFSPGLGGHATNVSITGVTKNDGSPLEGGEKTIRINLDVTGAPSGTESIEVKPQDGASIKDFSDNYMGAAATITDFLNKEPWIKVNNLDENNAFVEIVFSDTVFNSSGAALTSSDFSGLDFQQGAGGNATAATIDSITNTNDIVLNTGEDTIRVYLNITGIPSGEETIEIGPLSDTSIVNSISNPLAESDTLLFTLKDRLLPTHDSAYVNNANDYILFFASESLWTNPEHSQPLIGQDFELGFTQNINMGGTVQGATIAALKKEDGVSDLTGGEKTIAIMLTLTPPGQLASGDEQILVKVKDGASIYDRNGNPMDNGVSTDSLTLHDKLPPGIDSLRIINSNDYANLYFSEGIYDSTTGPIGPGVFGDLNFQPGNDPGATDVQIDSLRKSNGLYLTGGETQIRVYLTVSGIPSGTESIELKPQDNISIKDFSDNYMGTVATSTDFLNSFPRILDSTLSDENSYVQLIFNEEVFNLSNEPLSSSDFIIDEFVQGDSGNAEDAIISSITDVNNNLLTTGEDTIRLVITLMNPPASGVETIKIQPLTDLSIINEIGNPLIIRESSRTYLLNDRYPPYIYPNTTLTIPPDTILVIQTNEKIYTDTLDNEGISNVEISDFHLEFYNNGGNATNAIITKIRDVNDNLLDPSGGDSTIRIHFTLFGILPSGVEEVEISPNSPASIYDGSANPMLRTSTSGKVLLPDRLPPKINLPTADIPNDNSYVIITLTEGVYGNSIATIPVEPSDFLVEFMSNGGNATDAEVDYITNSLQLPVVGGEDTLHCYLEFQGTPSGHESFYIRTDTNSVFDANGNALEFSRNSWEVDLNTDTLRLNDQLVPTVDSVSIAHGSPIISSIGSPINITFSEPIQSFSYSISARHYNYLTYSDTTTATSFKLSLDPPLASLDTITLSISNLTDSAGLEAVNFSYEFYTPPLGDYDIDDRVNVEDLAQFVSFWMADSQPLVWGLGPTSGTFPHLVPNLDDKYDLDDGMTFIRMWSWSVDRFGLEPPASPPIGIAMNWDKLVVDVPTEAIAGQVYLRYNPLQGKVDLHHTGFGNNNLTMKREAIENGEILLEFGLVDPDDDARVISIKSEINEPADATVIYKFFAEDQSLIAAGTQKIALVIPTEFRLMQNYPNPFNNTTIIPYAVPEETFVQLEIFDINGRHVETLTSQFHEPGFHTLHWSGRSAASGVYFIKLEAAKTVLTQKMILLK